MNDRVVVLGHTLALETADRAIVGQQVKHHHDDMMLISSISFTSGFLARLWLAYTGCQMTCIGHLNGASGLHFNHHKMCTM